MVHLRQLALALSTVTGLLHAGSTPTGVWHTVIEAATPEMPRADTASVAELADGKLMVVYQHYEAGKLAGNDLGKCRIWCKTSNDGGLHWGDSRMLVDIAPGDLNVAIPALVRLASGDLLLACLRVHSGSSSTECLFRSRDGGRTFVEEPPIWKESKGCWLQGGAGSLLELRSGRLLFPVHGGSGDKSRQKNSAWCFLSNDGGKSWRRSRTQIDLPKRGAMEASVAQLPDGVLVMSLRTQLGGPYICRSSDEGETWTEAQPSGLESGESCTCLRVMPGTSSLVLFYNNSKFVPKGHHHFGERTPLTAAVSHDGGKTWRIAGNLAEDPAAEYTNLNCTFTRDGRAIVTYMAGKPAWNRTHINLEAAVVDPGWLKTTTPISPPSGPATGSGNGLPRESNFLANAKFDIQPIFEAGRLPNVLVTTKGTVIVVHGAYDGKKKEWWDKGVQVRRSEDAGKTWGEPITVANPGWNAGGANVDETSGDILVFVEQMVWPTSPTEQAMCRSSDDGKTWKKELPVIKPDAQGRAPSLHMAEHGIQLQCGKHKGRLLRPARYFGPTGDRRENYPVSFNTALYSDDGGKTWLTSEPFPAMGTGEGCVAELSDGRIYYDSRRHWDPPGSTYDQSMRWHAWSDDGGATWKDLAISKVLPDGARGAIDPGSGCMAGLVRLPIKDRDILLYSNCDSENTDRKNVSVWASFDGAKTWPIKRRLFDGPSAYSSLNVGRPGTPSEGWIYVMMEAGKKHRNEGAQVARFNLSWLLKGEKTGDGELPEWVMPDAQ